jgi:hypothetical protein
MRHAGLAQDGRKRLASRHALQHAVDQLGVFLAWVWHMLSRIALQHST